MAYGEISWPKNPSLGEVYTSPYGRTWVYDGCGWVATCCPPECNPVISGLTAIFEIEDGLFISLNFNYDANSSSYIGPPNTGALTYNSSLSRWEATDTYGLILAYSNSLQGVYTSDLTDFYLETRCGQPAAICLDANLGEEDLYEETYYPVTAGIDGPLFGYFGFLGSSILYDPIEGSWITEFINRGELPYFGTFAGSENVPPIGTWETNDPCLEVVTSELACECPYSAGVTLVSTLPDLSSASYFPGLYQGLDNNGYPHFYMVWSNENGEGIEVGVKFNISTSLWEIYQFDGNSTLIAGTSTELYGDYTMLIPGQNFTVQCGISPEPYCADVSGYGSAYTSIMIPIFENGIIYGLDSIFGGPSLFWDEVTGEWILEVDGDSQGIGGVEGIPPIGSFTVGPYTVDISGGLCCNISEGLTVSISNNLYNQSLFHMEYVGIDLNGYPTFSSDQNFTLAYNASLLRWEFSSLATTPNVFATNTDFYGTYAGKVNVPIDSKIFVDIECGKAAEAYDLCLSWKDYTTGSLIGSTTILPVTTAPPAGTDGYVEDLGGPINPAILILTWNTGTSEWDVTISSIGFSGSIPGEGPGVPPLGVYEFPGDYNVTLEISTCPCS